ncbi:GtrA family protein [Reichenbachiella sp. MALMAid0571]|uniref:GtrA family protein n=1 Tax=Reichenbachiella sp. MALMAid0571 TaxID=3143939 RepID=UPI0032DE5378
MTPDKPSGKTSFFRYNIAALLATAGDFLTLIFLTELVGLWYLASTSLGAIVGAIIAFTLGRNWAFVSKEETKTRQAIKYGIVALGSMGLNTLGVFFFTEVIEIQYVISKSITAGIVALGYNYPLSKYYTFK